MNGPIKMYRTKKIVRHDTLVKLPSCMYKLKNIHSGKNGMVDDSSDHVSPTKKKLDIIDQNNQHIPEMAELQTKQEEILKQLAELKEQILSIKSSLKLNVVTEKGTTICSNKIPDLPNIVVNINPNNPPYSLAIIQKLLQDVVTLKVTSHLHSTISELPDIAKNLENELLNFKVKTIVPEIHIHLIWKNRESSRPLEIQMINRIMPQGFACENYTNV